MNNQVNQQSVIIIGGGLAGLAAAAELAPYGFRITLLESRNRLGGRASSFQDSSTKQLIDNCQHVSMGCCTNFTHFCKTLGIDKYLEAQKCLYFITPDGRVSRFFADRWPAPFHLTRSFLTSHYLTGTEKLRIAYGLFCLQRMNETDDPPFSQWLQENHQTERTVNRFWGLVLVSALNETPDRIGTRYARKVFVDGFLTHPRGFEVQLPSVALGKLYGEELQRWLAKHRVDLQLNRRVKEIQTSGNKVKQLVLRDGSTLNADWYISAVSFDRLLDMLPEAVIEREDYFKNLKNLQVSPITSVHVWFDRAVMDLPHAVVVDGVGQWIFNRGRTGKDSYYVQVVVSAARQFRGKTQEEVQNDIVDEIRRLFPMARNATVQRIRTVTEHAATFSAVPGVDRWRPKQESPIPNLLVAGDWTATGWPATMEGAVRSGYLATEALLKMCGIDERVLQADLA